MSASRFLTVAEASRQSGVARWLLHRLVKARSVKSYLVGNRRRLKLSDVLAAVRESTPSEV